MVEPNKGDQFQLDFYKKLSGEERLKIADELSDLSRKLMEAGLRDAHPQWSDEEIRRERMKRLLPLPLFQKAYPPC